MQTANVMLSLGGDSGTQVPKYGITASEIAVLRLIHGADAVTEVEPLEDIERTHREEIARLAQLYGRAKVDDGNGDQRSPVTVLFPGAAARTFDTIDEIGLPEEFFKPTQRMTAKTVAKAEPAAEPKKKAKTKAEKAEKEAEAEAGEADGENETADPGIFQ